ncbi:transposon Ty3-I Gag-Pol polyprotein [Nephila pilipes]|uniref:Transposon Ty3-I Gag-Pol polyprotein n=1 Tax=Nephila pilipes TaxID=299642 RepID=A0A8X6I8R0_NEPPI|nr:transposon Ty3-I Gag-Pol polyprotein [Nephila pilipes]
MKRLAENQPASSFPITSDKATVVAERIFEMNPNSVSSVASVRDFLYTFSLAPDLKSKSSIDTVTNLKVPAKIAKGPPVAAKPRRLAPDKLKVAKDEFQCMIELNHIRPSKSAYVSSLRMEPNKDSVEWKPVGDYRALNAQTIKKNILYLVSRISLQNDLVNKCLVILALSKLYPQIQINPAGVHKTEICTPFGLFESLRMQFGLCNTS